MDDTQDEAFIEKFENERSSDGYGLVMDKGSAEKQEMASEFNDAPDEGTMAPEDLGTDAEDFVADLAPDAAPVEVGGPMAATSVEATDLPPIEQAAPAAAAAPKKSASADDMTFGQAFKAARADGKGAFTWRGKSFSTKLKSEAVKPRPAPMAKPAPDEVAAESIPDAAPPQAAPVQAAPAQVESTSGIGPRLNPAMQPKPGARSIYEGAVSGSPSKTAKVAPMMVAGEDGSSRPAKSVAELVMRKGAQ